MSENEYGYIVCENKDEGGVFYTNHYTGEILAFVQAGRLVVNKHRVADGERSYIEAHFATRNSLTFKPSEANDLESAHDTVLAEAELLEKLSKGRHLGEPEQLLLKQWERQLKSIALNMANQLPFVAAYSIDDYRVKE